MATLSSKFADLKARREGALVLFVTAGDPPLAELPSILQFLAESGADIIEVGIPFSDPIADGPTIQASSQRALDRGVTPQDVYDAMAKWDNPGVPLVAMGYYNPILRRGLEASAADLHAAGVAASIISDLTPEESDAWVAASSAEGLDTVFLAAPTSTDARLQEVGRRATGFLYAISRTGVTGSAQAESGSIEALVSRIRAHTAAPICVGFGISTPDQVREVCQCADGAVVGSWLVDRLQKDWDDVKSREELGKMIYNLKQATRSVAN
jgi:tryptophan synthase alpha chain